MDEQDSQNGDEVTRLTMDYSCRTMSNMKTTISVRHQISIPKAICDQLDLKPGTRIDWDVSGDKLVGRPMPAGAWTRLIGLRKKGPDLVGRLLRTREEERKREV